jgi:hypothetical protein
MNNFVKALALLRDVCDQADVIEQPAIEVRFHDKRDLAYFEGRLKNSFDSATLQYAGSPWGQREMTVLWIPDQTHVAGGAEAIKRKARKQNPVAKALRAITPRAVHHSVFSVIFLT